MVGSHVSAFGIFAASRSRMSEIAKGLMGLAQNNVSEFSSSENRLLLKCRRYNYQRCHCQIPSLNSTKARRAYASL